MNHLPSLTTGPSSIGEPVTLPLTADQYESLVDRGDFDRMTGQIELINGRIVRMNPQGPQHSDPIDLLTEWSFEQPRVFTIRVEKPIVIPDRNSVPEPDIAWATRHRYADRHPGPDDIQLLIEVSMTSGAFDRAEKMQLYAAAKIKEYWRVDVPSRCVIVHRTPSKTVFEQVESHGVDTTIAPLCMPKAKLAVERLFVD